MNEEVRDDLAQKLYERDDAAEFTSWEELPDWNRRMWLADADALLPTVRRLIADELRAAEVALQDIDALVQIHAWGEEDPLGARDRLEEILRDYRRGRS